jgi:hypothetical protein
LFWGLLEAARQLVDSKNVPNSNNGIVIIKKWKTVLGQTLYTKDFQLNDNRPQSHQPNGQTQLTQPTTIIAVPQATEQLSDQASVVIRNQPPAPQEKLRQSVLNSTEITTLIDEPLLKGITLRKVLRIVNALLSGNESNELIAKRMKVEKAIVDSIKRFVR